MSLWEWCQQDEEEPWQKFLQRIGGEPSASETVMSVSELNRYIKKLLDEDELLKQVWVRGEISRWQVYQSGHAYFTLKDERSQLKCVMWNSALRYLNFNPQIGDHVRVLGEVRVFERDGVYQLYAARIVKEGLGELYQQFEALRQKLAAEGLFDEHRKRPLPPFPQLIGVITSPDGAAIRDIIRIARQRHSGVQIILFPSLVQGNEAAPSLVRALILANSQGVEQLVGKIHVLIIGRGGGSVEDLWAFNEEAVVRAVAASRIPIVSAVGHESDFTLTDFAADFRAPTPTAAAQKVVPDRQEWLERSAQLALRLNQAFRNEMKRTKFHIERLYERRCFSDPISLFGEQRQSLDSLHLRLDNAARHQINAKNQRLWQSQNKLAQLSPKAQLERWRERFRRYAEAITAAMKGTFHHRQQALQMGEAKLQTLNPYAVLQRGYALVRDIQTQRVLTRAAKFVKGQGTEIVMADGTLQATVTKVVVKDEPSTP